MKRPLWLVLLPVLILSLWFNWRALQGTGSAAPASGAPPAVSPATALPGPAIPDAIDFTGTGFDDEAWKLDPAVPTDPIPDQLPEDGLPAAPALPAEWDLNLPLQPGTVAGQR